jgi:hypothetical protein
MQPEKIFDDISKLPPEAQQQVADFIAFLRRRYKRSESEPKLTEFRLQIASFTIYMKLQIPYLATTKSRK